MKKISLLVLLLTVVAFVACNKSDNVQTYTGVGVISYVGDAKTFVLNQDDGVELFVDNSPVVMNKSMVKSRWTMKYSIDKVVEKSDGTNYFDVTCYEMDSIQLYPVRYLSDYTNDVVPDSVGTRSVHITNSLFAADYLTLNVKYGYEDAANEPTYTLVFVDSLFKSGSKSAEATLYSYTKEKKPEDNWTYFGSRDICFDLTDICERLVELDTLLIDHYHVEEQKKGVIIVKKYGVEQMTH